MFFEEARGETPYLSVPIGDQIFFVRTDDGGVGKGIFVKGWRRDMTILDGVMARLVEYGITLPEEPIFVDVGANIGTTTVPALIRHRFATAVAVEPVPENVRVLRMNLVANSLDDRAQAIFAAASDVEGELTFDVSRKNSGGHRMADAGSEATVTVPAVTLDGLVDRRVIDVDRAGLVWIDAVGNEGRILLGASKLISAGIPVVVGVRRNLPLPPEIRERVLGLVSESYTDVVELRDFLARHPIGDFADLVDSFRHTTDLLLIRR
jgi:FkbM family methyltransferase